MTTTPISARSTLPATRVAVIGCGLMGGSIGKAARAAGHHVVMYDSDLATNKAMQAEGFVVAANPEDACAGSDIVLICTPVDYVADVANEIKHYLANDTIVTEIGSVKASVRALEEALSGERVEVVPTHPMVGSEQSGFLASSPAVINGCTWLMCPREESPSTERLAEFLRSIGAARCLMTSYDEHDVAVAIVSHLPQMVATLTAGVAGKAEASHAKGAFMAAGGGFRDTTRLADSPLSMWRPVLEANGPIVADLLIELADRCRDAAEALQRGDLDTIAEMFTDGHKARETWRAAQVTTSPNSTGTLHG